MQLALKSLSTFYPLPASRAFQFELIIKNNPLDTATLIGMIGVSGILDACLNFVFSDDSVYPLHHFGSDLGCCIFDQITSKTE